MCIRDRYTIVYRTWIGTTSDLHPTVHVRYTSGSTDPRPVHVLLVYVLDSGKDQLLDKVVTNL